MADIPVFPAGTNVGSNVISRFPVENMDRYGEGLQQARLQPSITSSIVGGVKEGLDFAQNYEHNELINQRLAVDLSPENLAAKRKQQELEAIQTQQEIDLAPKKLSAQEAQINAQEVRANAELIQAQTAQASAPNLNKLKLTQADNEAKKIQLEVDKANMALKDQQHIMDATTTINSAYTTMRGGNAGTDPAGNPVPGIAPNVSAALDDLESRPEDLITAAVKPDTEKKGLAYDYGVIAKIQQLPAIAAAKGTPQDVERANKIVDQFNDQLRNAGNMANGVFAPRVSTTGAPAAAAPNALTGSGSQPTQYQTPTTNIASQDIVFPKAGLDYGLGQLPKNIIEQDVATVEADKAISERLYSGPAGADLAPKLTERADQILAADEARGRKTTRDQATRAAAAELKAITWLPAQSEKVDKLATAVRTDRANLQQGTAAMQRLEDLMEEAELPPEFGATNSLARTKDTLLAKFRSDPEKEALINGVYSDLTALGFNQMIGHIAELGISGKTIDSAQEQQKALLNYSTPDATVEKNIAVLHRIAGLLGEAEGSVDIAEYARKRNLPYSAAQDLANSYVDANPGTTPGKINGKPYPVYNAGRIENGYKFIDQVTGLTDQSLVPRKETGRVVTAPSIPPDKAASFASDFAGAVESGRASKVVPPGSAIPDHLPDAKPTMALASRMAQVESSFNPNAESKDSSAKGLFQFIDSTGKHLWEQANKPGGEYNPKDPKQATTLWYNHMSQLLDRFGGDTRLALAGYMQGAPMIGEAIDKAKQAGVPISWDSVQDYLPASKKVGDRTISPRKDAVDYVRKIMSDPEHGVVAGLVEDASNVANTLRPYADVATMLNPFSDMGSKAEVVDRNNLGQAAIATVGGFNKSALYGFDDEAAGAIGAGLSKLGIPGRTGSEYTDTINTAYDSGPLAKAGYVAGRIGGAIPGAIEGIAIKGAEALGLRTASTGVETLGSALAGQSVGNVAKRVAIAAGTRAGIEGIGEGAPADKLNVVDRLINGTVSAGVGAVTGLALGAASQAFLNKINSRNKLDSIEKVVSDAFKKGTPEELAVLEQDLAASPEGQGLLAIAKNDELLSGVKQAVSESPGASKVIASEAEKSVAGQTTKVKKALGTANTNITNDEAATKAVQAVKGRVETNAAELRAEGQRVYDNARAGLPKGAVKNPDKLPDVPKRTPIFTSDDVKDAIKNPLVSKVVTQSIDDVGQGVLPKESFEVLHDVQQKLTRQIDTGGQTGQSTQALRTARDNLVAAMDNEHPGYAEATAKYKQAAEILRDPANAKGVAEIAKLADPETSKDATLLSKKLLAQDVPTIKKTLSFLSGDEQEAVQMAVRKHLETEVLKKGDDQLTLEVFNRTAIPAKLEAIFGKEADTIVTDLKTVLSTAKAVEDVTKAASPVTRSSGAGKGVREVGGDLPGGSGMLQLARSVTKTIGSILKNTDKSYSREELEDVVKLLLDKDRGVEYLQKLQSQFNQPTTKKAAEVASRIGSRSVISGNKLTESKR